MLTKFIQDFVQDDRNISLLRVGGELLNADMQYDAKFPLLSPVNTYKICISSHKTFIFIELSLWCKNSNWFAKTTNMDH